MAPEPGGLLCLVAEQPVASGAGEASVGVHGRVAALSSGPVPKRNPETVRSSAPGSVLTKLTVSSAVEGTALQLLLDTKAVIGR